MKSRLSSTVWMLVLWNAAALIGTLLLAYSAGRSSGGAGLADVGSMSSSAIGSIFGALLLSLFTILILGYVLSRRVLTPVQGLAEFSERLAAGDPRARVEVTGTDELAHIAENLNRAVVRVSKATSNQEASDSLQRSITELLAVINQVARGDLTLRGKVTNDALGNVTDSSNYMLY